MPGFASVQPIGEPVSVSAPGHTFGETITRKIALTTPNSTPVTAPAVLNRRHVSASSSAGKLALAATANASPTMNETFRPVAADHGDRRSRSRRSRSRRCAPTTTSSCSESLPLRTMFDQMSCDTAADADSTRPATTARIVANATPAMTARNRSPPNVPSPPPRNWRQVRRREVAAGAGGLHALLAQERARAEADERRQQVEEADDEHRPDDRRARGLGVRDGEEPHQDVRQAGRAEHEREARARPCRSARPGTCPGRARTSTPRRPAAPRRG